MHKEVSFVNQIVSVILTRAQKKKIYKKYSILFLLLLIICSILFFIYIFRELEKYKNEQISQSLANKFSITSLYAGSSSYSSSYAIQESVNLPFVIGMIRIDKIDVFYPILSFTSKENLKVAPCKFYGPNPNEVGNLCIAAHNYVDNKLFSRIHTLESNDCIQISNLQGNTLNYYVYAIYEVEDHDVSCTSQDTQGNKEITLITCNNVNGTRVIVKART